MSERLSVFTELVEIYTHVEQLLTGLDCALHRGPNVSRRMLLELCGWMIRWVEELHWSVQSNGLAVDDDDEQATVFLERGYLATLELYYYMRSIELMFSDE